jgi:hypothetical protein
VGDLVRQWDRVPPDHERTVPAAWEGDAAHEGLRQWIKAWRVRHPVETVPSSRFARHLGAEAVKLAADGMSRVALIKMFTAAGYENRCLCEGPTSEVPDEMMLDEDQLVLPES